MSDAPTTTRKIEITAKIERADGNVEHVKLVNGKWVPHEPAPEPKPEETWPKRSNSPTKV